MKRAVLFLLVFFVSGCALGENIIRDQEFADFKQERDAVERRYLNKDLTYAEYLKQKQQLEQEYDLKVQERQEALYHNP